MLLHPAAFLPTAIALAALTCPCRTFPAGRPHGLNKSCGTCRLGRCGLPVPIVLTDYDWRLVHDGAMGLFFNIFTAFFCSIGASSRAFGA